MIFTVDDLLLFAPSVSLPEDAVTGAIYFVQSIIEGDRGADRPLEITRHREKLRVNLKFQNFRLTYVSINTPLVSNPAPIIKARLGNITDGFNRAIAPDSWQTLGSDDYIIDVDGQIHLSTAISRSWGYWGYHGYNREPYPEFSEADVEYSSGIDFSQDTRQTREIKAAFGRILDWVCNTGSFKGVSSVELPFEEVKINYGTGQLGTIPDDLLMVFKKYRPISL
jgi:hypothetical protein|uniref:Uncharacterized protein n=1 Tax=Bacteriophage sp. TaxID=38018 RepID=A0A7G9A4E6_9VIRU|nr:MAG: hypothetical protein [Bacteriophage sp.]